MRKEDIVAGEDFFDLMYSDQEFSTQLGRAMLAAGRLETELKAYFTAHSVQLKNKRPTLGQLIDILRKHNLLPKMQPHLEMIGKQRNYLAHSLYDLLSGEIEKTLLPCTDLIALDVYTYTARVRELEENLEGLTAIVRAERLANTKHSPKTSKKEAIPQLHIAHIDFTALYLPAFSNPEESKEFVKQVESIQRDNTKIVLHQAGRMVWLGDQIEKVAAGRPALQILFYMIAAEAVSKMVFNYEGEHKSKEYTKKFFSDICCDQHRKVLANAFARMPTTHSPNGKLSWEEAVDLLYAVRCDVAHKGKYYDLHLKSPTDSGNTEMLSHRWRDCPIFAMISLPDIRTIILQGTILGCRQMLAKRK